MWSPTEPLGVNISAYNHTLSVLKTTAHKHPPVTLSPKPSKGKLFFHCCYYEQPLKADKAYPDVGRDIVAMDTNMDMNNQHITQHIHSTS